MTNFLFYLGEYQKNRCRDAGVELTPNRLVVKVPNCSKQNATAVEFFAGKNVVDEEITTYNGFCYKATLSAGGHHSESDLENLKLLLREGLNELGVLYRECDLKEISTKKNTNYEVMILCS